MDTTTSHDYTTDLATQAGRQAEQDRAQGIQDAMEKDGVQVRHSARRSFFGKPKRERFYFSGQEGLEDHEKQYLVVQKMLEGDRARYQEATTTKVVVESITKNTALGLNQARDRTELILCSVKGWHVFRNEEDTEPAAWEEDAFIDWLRNAEPTDVDDLTKFIRDLNPWLEDEATLESLEQEMVALKERIQRKRETETAKKS